MRPRLLLSMFAVTAALSAQVSLANAQTLFFSEYIEGSSNNKALEIFNGTGTSVDLADYQVQMFFNGNTSPGLTVGLSGSLASGEVFVLAQSSADPAILAVADQTSGAGFFNGDDAVVLVQSGTIIDVIGRIGEDPGSEWGSGDTSTANNTLRRQSAITSGDADGSDFFDPAAEWDGFPSNTFDGLGSHSGSTPPPGTGGILINELDADTAGTDTLEFVELYDGGIGNTSLDGLVLVFYNGNGDTSYRAIDLDGFSTDADGFFLLGNSAVSGVSIVFPNNGLQNGADAVALYAADGGDFANGTPVTTDNLIDAVVYDTSDADDAQLLVLLEAGEPQLDENELGTKDSDSLQRCPDGGARTTSTFTVAAPTPGSANACGDGGGGGGGGDGCFTPATFIHAIQGNGISSPLVGETHSIEGVVVGDFQDTQTQLRGFYVQEEDSDADLDDSTSEGIFVFDNGFGVDVAIGDLVNVTGEVSEFGDQTQLTNISAVEVCGAGPQVSFSNLTLPLSAIDFPERFEGMAISLPQTLVVTNTFFLGRFGEVWLSSGDRRFNPTNVVTPGAEAVALQEENDRNLIVLDDASTRQNPDPIPYPAPGLSAQNTLRGGDTATGISGVLAEAFGAYRVHPTTTPVFDAANPRPVEPDLPGTGNLRVASFNVLNYFNGDGNGGGFPTPRGADTPSELVRQQDKIVTAILSMDADIIGLMELENDGYGPDSAIQELVDALNANGDSYEFVDPGLDALGGDAIAVGIIYRPQIVRTIGPALTLDTAPFDQRNRQPLLQTFKLRGTHEKLTVVVNHFKSKGGCPASGPDADQGDGQGCFNPTRTAASQALADWLATDPSGSNDPDFLVMGDLNAYAKEDPISAFESVGYTNLIAEFIGQAAYSFSFDGQYGYLDHALATAGLTAQSIGVTEWHINADEPVSLDYNEEFKSPGQVISLYSPDAFRASDHDPVIIEFNLGRTGGGGYCPPFHRPFPPRWWPPRHRLPPWARGIIRWLRYFR